jgi:hypothetical protein
VEDPGDQRDEHAEREPLGAEQADRAREWVPQAYVRRGACATMLEQKAHVRGKGTEECKKNSELKHWLWIQRKIWDREAVFSPHR